MFGILNALEASVTPAHAEHNYEVFVLENEKGKPSMQSTAWMVWYILGSFHFHHRIACGKLPVRIPVQSSDLV